MSGLNIINILLLSFRFAPIIIVSFFLLQSFFYLDLKGIIYICGLIFTTILAIICSFFFSEFLKVPPLTKPVCIPVISLGENGEYFSKIPLHLIVYSYTFFYLLIFILNLGNTTDTKGILNTKNFNSSNVGYGIRENLPILIFYPLLTIADIIWNMSYECLSIYQIILALVLGAVGGVIWSIIITAVNIPQLQYNVFPNKDVCSRPTKTKYRCRPKV